MRLHMVIKLLARELALSDFVLVLVRSDAVFLDSISMTVFNGLGNVRGVSSFVAVPRLGGIGRIRGGRGGRRGGRFWRGCGGRGVGGVVESCGADGGGCGEPWWSQYGVRRVEAMV